MSVELNGLLKAGDSLVSIIAMTHQDLTTNSRTSKLPQVFWTTEEAFNWH